MKCSRVLLQIREGNFIGGIAVRNDGATIAAGTVNSVTDSSESIIATVSDVWHRNTRSGSPWTQHSRRIQHFCISPWKDVTWDTDRETALATAAHIMGTVHLVPRSHPLYDGFTAAFLRAAKQPTAERLTG